MSLEQTQLKVANESLASGKRDRDLAKLIDGLMNKMGLLIRRIEKKILVFFLKKNKTSLF